MLEGKVICFDSIKINEYEYKYITHDLEIATIVHALKMKRHYFLKIIFFLMIDQCGLKCLLYQPRLNARQARCMALISEFDFEIKHVK